MELDAVTTQLEQYQRSCTQGIASKQQIPCGNDRKKNKCKNNCNRYAEAIGYSNRDIALGSRVAYECRQRVPVTPLIVHKPSFSHLVDAIWSMPDAQCRMRDSVRRPRA
jgi:hypothetical protein